MAEQHLNDANVSASLQEMSSETVPQRIMGGDRLVLILARLHAARQASCKAPEQPHSGPRSPPIGPKDLQEPRRQHGVAIFAAFACVCGERRSARF